MFFVESRTNQLGLCRYIYPFYATDLFRYPPPPPPPLWFSDVFRRYQNRSLE